MGRPGRREVFLAGCVVLVVLVGVGIWAFTASTAQSGDPGGKVLAQLTPTVSVLPGYGTSTLPWVNQIPPALDAAYIIKTEPRQDSCDGRAGTQGWSQVVVQAGFHWKNGLQLFVARVEPQLATLGWTVFPQPPTAYPPTATWTKHLANGGRGFLDVTQEGGTSSSNWELVATGDPAGKAASGC